MAEQALKAVDHGEGEDPVAALGIKLISSDNHVNEPRDLYTRRFPKHLQDRAPRVVEGRDGGEGWSLAGEMPKRTYGIEAMAGFDPSDYRLSGLRYSDLRPGNYDPDEHLKDMDIDGIYASVLYPGVGAAFYVHPDKEVAAAAFVAYNDWMLDDFQPTDPKRLCGLALAPLELGVDHTVAEMQRVSRKGCRAMYIPGTPSVPYNHPTHYEKFWQAAQDLDITLCMHRNHGGPVDRSVWDDNDPDKVSIGRIVSRYFIGAERFSYMIFAGIFDRYPGLRVVNAEVDCGWAPFWVQTMEHHWKIQKSWFPVHLEHSPIEFIGKNVFTSNVDDYCGYDLIKTGLYPWLSSMTMFSSDYPHSATIWPNSRRVAAKMIDGMKSEDARKALSENAARVFKFDI